MDVLTDANFEEYVKTNDYAMVEFYAPWYVGVASEQTFKKRAGRIESRAPPCVRLGAVLQVRALQEATA